MSGEITPLNKQLEKLAKFIGVMGFGLAVLTFTSLFIKDLFLKEISDNLTLIQVGSVGIVITSALVALVKIWLPII